MEVKSILKSDKRLKKVLPAEDGSTTQSSSIGVVRWALPDESVQVHSSAPSRRAEDTPKSSQQHPRQSGMKDLRSLQECVQFVQHWKEQVDQVCKGGDKPDDGKKEAESSDRRTERSLEESRKLILEWANEFHHVHQVSSAHTGFSQLLIELVAQERESKEDEDGEEEAHLRIMEWAKELQKATESCGVQSEEVGKVLRLLGLKKKRLANLLPLLEFITWSLLKEDSAKMIPQLWLLAKQRTWKAGIQRYIPNSVWSWICSATANVILDPMTNHPWLVLSEDQRQVQEGHSETEPSHSTQRFDSWPCVLGLEGYSCGRHYWEVNIANNGYWRVGLASGSSKREGRFPMTPKQGYWTLWRSTLHFYVCSNPETQLPVSLVPRRMGIYLDYEGGQISFYNAETKFHIYTFTGSFKEKLYPLLAPMDGRALLTVLEPHEIST
ncbi:zinc-binding protein A33 [Embiotoca jacksoni]|uniref:zinc-binding protein A33 n=1 Tax=Embiotoca jacksoni TaxID=100190 RepID=UPI0037049C6A